MFKIEEDFDTTLDIITIILENEDVMLNNTFKRKYGVTLKSSGLYSVTMNTKKRMTYIENLVKLDIAIAKRLDKDLVKFSNFLNDFNILEKLSYVYELPLEEVEEYHEKMPLKAKQEFDFIFGIDCDKKSIEEVAMEFDSDVDEVLSLVMISLKQIIRTINNNNIKTCENSKQSKLVKSVKSVKQNNLVKTVKTVQQNNSNIPLYFLKIFTEKGYKQSEIINALALYEPKVRKTLFNLYGKNYECMINHQVHILQENIEIIKSLLDGEKSLEKTLIAMRSSLKLPDGEKLESFNLKNYYMSLGFNDEEFSNSFSEMTTPEKKFIKKFFDAHFNVCITTVLNEEEKLFLHNLCFNNNCGIYKKLIEHRNTDFNKDFVLSIIEYYKNMGFNNEEIMNAYFKLNKEFIDTIRDVYNGNLELQNHFPKTDTVKRRIITIVSSSKTGFSQYLSRSYDKEKKLPNIVINETDFILNSVFSVYAFFGLKGVFADVVDEAISFLDNNYSKAFNNYYTQAGLLKVKYQENDISIKDIMIKIGDNINNLVKLRKEKEDKIYSETIGVCVSMFKSFGYDEKMSLVVLKSLKQNEMNALIKYAKSGLSFNKNSNGEIELAFIKFVINYYLLSNVTRLKEYFKSFGFKDETLNKFNDINEVLSTIGETKNTSFLNNILNGNINVNELTSEQLSLTLCLIRNISEKLIAYELNNNKDSKIKTYKDMYDYFRAVSGNLILTPNKVSKEFGKNENEFYYLMTFAKCNYLSTITPDFMNITGLIYLDGLKKSFDLFLERYKKYIAYKEVERKLKKIGK